MARKKSKSAKRPPAGAAPALPGTNPAIQGSPDDHPGLPFRIVCAGASAGGLPALSQLLRALPADTGMAYVFVQHLEPTHASMLSEILSRDTHMAVHEVVDGMALTPDHVYVIPPGKSMVLDGGRLMLLPRSRTRGLHHPIDQFMRSLAERQAERAIGVILSGTASDGTQGLIEIKAAGGITFAQDSTAEQDGMPRSAIASGCVDFVLPPAAIGAEIVRIGRHREALAPADAEADPAALSRVFELLRRTTGVDFANYKRNTLSRRIRRRMLLHKIDTLAEYVRLLQAERAEVEALYQDVLINVTGFFRDPEAYDALKTVVFPRLTQDRQRQDPVRVWALGCSTGQEAYSIAMAFLEYAEEAGVRVPMQVFATDLNGAAIEKARAGVYPAGIAEDLPPQRLKRFFVERDGAYRVDKAVREMCVFARHNVLSDPPFSRMDLVACRNLLIYLDPGLQEKVIPLLHYALQPHGFLWLGGSETIGSYRDLFELQEPRHKIYARRPGPGRSRAHLLLEARVRDAAPAAPPAPRPRDRAVPAPDPQREADRLLLARYAPAGVLVNSDLDIVQFRGDTGPYLVPAPGRASLNLLKMLREGLLSPVRAAVSKVRRDATPLRKEGLRVRTDAGERAVDLAVLPVQGGAQAGGSLLVLFEEPARAAEGRARHAEARARAATEETALPRAARSRSREVARLQQELADMRDYLQSVIEQQETVNEELQSANEEVQSANEELQSTNEELETSREEIQSSNEELATVNDELQRRNLDLTQSNNDLVNLIANVQIAVVMLGQDLCIRRFTPPAEKLFNLIPSDIGRPITDIKLSVDVPDLEALLLEVIDTASVREREVRDARGGWFLLRARPYRTSDRRIDGAVLVLIDIDTLKRAEQDLRESDQRKDEFLAMLSHELRTPLAALRSAAQVLNTADAAPAAAQRARAVIERQTRNMGRMVDDLLDIVRITRGTIALRLEPVDLLASVRHAVDATQHQRAALSQQVTVALPEGPLTVKADAVRLDQIFANLLANASKYTPRDGHVWVAAERSPPTDSAPGQAVVRVRDNGVGIAPEELPRIFKLFSEGTRAPAHSQRGLGLGLTLARQLVELQGGTIEARSAGAAQGSEFIVQLPLHDGVAAADAADAPISGVQPRRVLVVDDNADAAETLRILLELDGHRVETAHDGRAAMDAAREFSPDIVLLDVAMPGMDGYAVARALRALPGLAGVKVVAVTGYARDDDIQRIRQAGFDHHLTKPVERRTLQDLLAQLPPRRRT